MNVEQLLQYLPIMISFLVGYIFGFASLCALMCFSINVAESEENKNE